MEIFLVEQHGMLHIKFSSISEIRCTFNLPLVENINFVHDAWKLYEPFPRSNRSDNNI